MADLHQCSEHSWAQSAGQCCSQPWVGSAERHEETYRKLNQGLMCLNQALHMLALRVMYEHGHAQAA